MKPRSIHWGTLKFEGTFKVMGRGDVYTLTINKDLFKVVPFKVGDTFDYEGNKRVITGLEMMKYTFGENNWSPHIGLINRIAG